MDMRETQDLVLSRFTNVFFLTPYASIYDIKTRKRNKPKGGLSMEKNIKVLSKEEGGMLVEYNERKVLLLHGSPYQMGYVHGKLFKDHVKEVVKTFIKGANEHKPGILEERLKLTEGYILDRYKEEMKGLAKGAELSEEEILLANVFPEAFHCSGVALFGNATADGSLLHGRILDYAVKSGLQDHPAIILAKPDGYNGFINVTVAGLIGSVTGMNDKQIAIGEMGLSHDGNFAGVPMTLLVRRALEEAHTLDEALSIFKNSVRTCGYCYVISDGKIPDARALTCTYEVMDTAKPGEGLPGFPGSPPKDVVMISKDERYVALLNAVNKYYGKIDKDILIEIMKRPVSMESNLHNAVFEPQKLKMWLAIAQNPDVENFQACYQPYYEYDMKELMKAF
jgi:isopenicillin-N N-acyltransferase-like protein